MSELVLQKNKLPQGWTEIEFKKIIKNIPLTGKKLKQKEYQNKGTLPVIDQGWDFIGGYTDKSELKIDCNLPVIVFGDHTKITKFVEQDFVAGADGVKVLELISPLNPKLVYYFIKVIPLPNKGYARHFQYLNNSTIRIPPIKEQKRIVEKIEELFSELDNVKSTLKNIKLLLEEYYQSLLKFAFEGKLTKKWRQENNSSLHNVLKKIEEGKKNQDKKLQNIVPDKVAFFEIPDEWNWAKVGNVSKEIQYGTSEKATTTKSNIPVLRMGNIQNGELDFNKLKYYPNNWKNFKTFELVDGDVLFNRTNSAELVGKTAVYRKHYPSAVFAGYIIRVKIINDTYIPALLSYYINSVFGKLYISSVVTQQVGQANVNSTKLFMMPLPLMSFEEQKELISKLEFGFSLIKNTKNIVNSLLSQLEALRSTILKQAFEGKLVPQDPNDEPTENLLQKIKQEKEQLKQKQKVSRSTKNVK